MLRLPAFAINNRVTLAGPNGQEITYQIDSFDFVDGWPVGRAFFLGSLGMTVRLPLDIPGVRLVDITHCEPAEPAISPDDRIRNARAALREHYPALSGLPHPVPSRAALGESLADYAVWCMANGGIACKLRVAGLIESALSAPRNFPARERRSPDPAPER